MFQAGILARSSQFQSAINEFCKFLDLSWLSFHMCKLSWCLHPSNPHKAEEHRASKDFSLIYNSVLTHGERQTKATYRVAGALSDPRKSVLGDLPVSLALIFFNSTKCSHNDKQVGQELTWAAFFPFLYLFIFTIKSHRTKGTFSSENVY